MGKRNKITVVGAGNVGASAALWIASKELADASTSIERIANNDMGIEWLDWQDTYQSFASGYTWPLGRGQALTPNALTDNVMRGLQGRAPKEALT